MILPDFRMHRAGPDHSRLIISDRDSDGAKIPIGVSDELVTASGAAEMVVAARVRCVMRGLLWIYGHAANRVDNLSDEMVAVIAATTLAPRTRAMFRLGHHGFLRLELNDAP
jgi:hypothetical protein